MKRKQPCPGFELGSPTPFPTMILSAPSLVIQVNRVCNVEMLSDLSFSSQKSMITSDIQNRLVMSSRNRSYLKQNILDWTFLSIQINTILWVPKTSITKDQTFGSLLWIR